MIFNIHVCVYLYVCTCGVRAFMHVCVRTYVYMYVCMYVDTHTDKQADRWIYGHLVKSGIDNLIG